MDVITDGKWLPRLLAVFQCTNCQRIMQEQASCDSRSIDLPVAGVVPRHRRVETSSDPFAGDDRNRNLP